MSNDEGESDQDIADEVLPVGGVVPAVPTDLVQIFPWHRPRKQLVRTRQWRYLTRRLLRRIVDGPSLRRDSDGRREVRYLTLPGTDYLDVRLLSDQCAAAQCDLTSVGFLAGDQSNPENARAHVREEALKSAGYITDRSHTLPRRFEDVSDTAGQAYLEIRKRGPFHVINIDACGSPAPPTAAHSRRIIDAIHRLVELQLTTANDRWLLFVTADVRSNNVAPQTLQGLQQAIQENANADASFEQRAREMLEQGAATIDRAMRTASRANDERFIRFFALGLGKWLLHLAQRRGWTMMMQRSYFYSTTSRARPHPSMPALAFEFVPPPPNGDDPYGVARSNASRPATEANDPSHRALTIVGQMLDVDDLMREDEALRQSMIAETKALLTEAGYSADAVEGLDAFDREMDA